MIEVNNVTKYFRTGFFGIKKNAVANLSLLIEKGKVTGFFGPNGAGKSTTIKMIVGLIKPSKGSIKINGYDSTDHRSRHKMGFLPENPGFPRGLKAAEVMNYYANILGIKSRTGNIERVLKLTGIHYAKDLQIHKYSKGMTQRLALSVSLLGDPEILILDEPLSGLDPIGRKEFKDIIIDLKKLKKTIFFSSHILADSKQICDKIALIVKGRLLKDENVSLMQIDADKFYQDIDKTADTEYKDALEEYLYNLMLKNK